MKSGRSSDRPYRVGDEVEIRPIGEILATLDAEGSLDALPFMPEMVRHCGGRLRVLKSAHKTCDPAGATNLRRIANAVHLETRCDGSAHGGCQAGCLFFWHSDWLRRAGETAPEATPAAPAAPAAQSDRPRSAVTLETLQHATRPGDGPPDAQRYRCQLTEIARFSTELPAIEPTQYLRDLSSGNVRFGAFARHGALAAVKGLKNALLGPGLRQSLKGLLRRLRGRAPGGSAGPSRQGESAPRPASRLGLQPGDLVRVRSADEISRTLDKDFKNLGLAFGGDMWQRSGRVYRVAGRIERILDEATGRMLHMRRDCVVLDGVCCMGTGTYNRLFCPRGALQFWRECWLERVPEGDAAPAPRAAHGQAQETA